MRISAIAAMDMAHGIGNLGGIPWRLPADLRRFREITMGHPVIMGRATWESIERPLAGRTNIVLSRNAGFTAEGITVAGSLAEALTLAASVDTGPDAEAMLIGGERVFTEGLPFCTALYLTVVGNVYPADTHFPRDWGADWSVVRREVVAVDERNTDPHLFVCFDRPEPERDYSAPSPLPMPQ